MSGFGVQLSLGVVYLFLPTVSKWVCSALVCTEFDDGEARRGGVVARDGLSARNLARRDEQHLGAVAALAAVRVVAPRLDR